MKKLVLFLAFMPLALVQSQVQAQTPAVSNAPLIRDPKAIALFGQAVDAYKGLKTFSAQFSRFDEPEVYKLEWAPPGKASLISKGLGVRRDGKAIADGKNVFRLLPGAPVFDRIPMRDDSDADAVFTISPPLFFGISPLLSGKNLAADERIARGVTLGAIPFAKDADAEIKANTMQLVAHCDVIRIQTVFPGESPDKLTDLIYAFDKKTHHLKAFWLGREVGGERKTVEIFVLEIRGLSAADRAKALVWTAPKGVKEVPFRGYFVMPTALAPIRPTLEPAALALLDKAAATYGGLKTLQMRIAGTGYVDHKKSPMSASLFYNRPNQVRVEDRAGNDVGLHIADGKTMLLKNDAAFVNEREPLDSPARQISDAMKFLSFPVGNYIADWTQGHHYFQPAILPEYLKGARLLELTRLPARKVNSQSVEGVRIRAKYQDGKGRPDFFWEHILWLKPENGALVRAQFQAKRAFKLETGAIDIVSQTFNAPIAASKFSIPLPAAKR